jgi:four helix bundle protein
MGRGVQRYNDLRAWQACDRYKKAVYRVCEDPPLSRDWGFRSQLIESVAGPPAHLAEGFGRFSPSDFARYAVMARASLIESQSHLHDAVDRRHITEECRRDLDALAEAALQEVTGLMEYLQSPEALRNARHARERRILKRQQRDTLRDQLSDPAAAERTTNPEPRTPNPEPRTPNHEHRTREPRTSKFEPNLNTNPEPGTKKSER